METAAFQAEAFGKPLCISTSVPQICNMCNLSCCELWVKDFVCSQGCFSNSFFEAIKRKKKAALAKGAGFTALQNNTLSFPLPLPSYTTAKRSQTA